MWGHVRSFVRRNARSPSCASRQSRDVRSASPGRSTAPTLTPQSKPVTHASRLVARNYAPLVAFGPGPGILAAGPVTYRQYSLLRRLCETDPNSLGRPGARGASRERGRFAPSPGVQPSQTDGRH